MRYLVEIPGLVELEQAEKWEEIRVMLLNSWEEDPSNPDKLYWLIAECWMVLVNWNIVVCGDIPVDTGEHSALYKTFSRTLIHAADYSLEHCMTQKIACLMGYMMHLFSFMFYGYSNDNASAAKEDALSEQGSELLKWSVLQNPDDLVAKVLSLRLESASQTPDYVQAFAQIQSSLDNLFPGETMVEQYFKGILTDKEQSKRRWF